MEPDANSRDRRMELAAKADELERQQRTSHVDVAEASNALEQLERRSLGGEKVSDPQRRSVCHC
jgi:hypothetical protein